MEIYKEKEGVLKFISTFDSFSITSMSIQFSNITVNSCFPEKQGEQYFLNQLKPNKIICLNFFVSQLFNFFNDVLTHVGDGKLII